MKPQTRFNKYEYIVYALLLIMIFLAPTFSALFHGHDITDTEFLKNDLLRSWKIFIVYVIAFAIHDLIIAPWLVFKHKMWYYVAGVIVLIGVFQLYQCSQRPDKMPPPTMEKMTQDTSRAPAGEASNTPEDISKGEAPILPDEAPPPLQRRDIVSFILLLFGLGTNLGVKLYVRSISAKQELEELEKENTEQQLVNLRYQLHPHFFMNTLNNIHALVDIDPKKAQECIIDLSKLMRYVLYESNHRFVRAAREEEFMANYVSLMRLRYNDKLEFTVDNPDDGTDICVPPLVFISFVENAFKHGVSYNKPSYIHLKVTRYTNDEGVQHMLWECRNSKHPKNGKATVSESSGVGIPNIRHRLDLLFGDKYTLDFNDGEKEFCVTMDIPVIPSDQSEYCEDETNNNIKTSK
ncbi:MAG: histidine kinase [Muribaculaceae bacterium]|nr:histidine kinase [Muribaculaceae bacterium]